MPEWPKGADCKSVGDAFVSSNLTPPTISNKIVGSPPKAGFPYLACPRSAEVAHLFGKEEVMGPIPIVGSTR